MRLNTPQSVFREHRSARAFTMIEVAMSLAIVAFAMVAIMGVMPTGLNVQRQNAEETIISQDGTYLMEAMRQGALATNLVQLQSNLTLIDVYSERAPYPGLPVGAAQRYYWDSSMSGKPSIQSLIAQLARPKQSEVYRDRSGGTYYYFTNSVRLRCQAMSGNMTAVLGSDSDRMQYEVTIDVISDGSGISDPNVFSQNNFTSTFSQGNLYTVKLTYRWPVLPNLQLGAGRKVLTTQFRGRSVPMRVNGSTYETIETANVTEMQVLSQSADMPNNGHVFEGTMLR